MWFAKLFAFLIVALTIGRTAHSAVPVGNIVMNPGNPNLQLASTRSRARPSGKGPSRFSLKIKDILLGTSSDLTRVVIELSYKADIVVREKSSRSFSIHIPYARVDRSLGKVSRRAGLIADLRILSEKKFRAIDIMLDMAKPMTLQKLKMLAPNARNSWRVILDFNETGLPVKSGDPTNIWRSVKDWPDQATSHSEEEVAPASDGKLMPLRAENREKIEPGSPKNSTAKIAYMPYFAAGAPPVRPASGKQSRFSLKIKNILLGAVSDFTRVVIDLSNKADIVVRKKDSRSFSIHIPYARVDGTAANKSLRNGLVSGLRIVQEKKFKALDILLDMVRPVTLRSLRLLPPKAEYSYRLVLEFEDSGSSGKSRQMTSIWKSAGDWPDPVLLASTDSSRILIPAGESGISPRVEKQPERKRKAPLTIPDNFKGSETDLAFLNVMHDPTNLDKAFRFAELAAGEEDAEAAISTLERMLFVNADLPRVKMELGLLYYRIQSYQFAQQYLTEAMAAPDVPPEIKSRIGEVLLDIENRLTRHAIAGSIYGGMRWQSNANSAPSSANVTAVIDGIGTVEVTLDDDSTQQADFNAFLSGTLSHQYQLDGSPEFWRSEASAYVSRQREQSSVDLLYLSAKSGPQYLSENKDTQSGGFPYLGLGVVYLEDSLYLVDPSLGMEIHLSRADGMLYSADANVAHKSYYDGGTRTSSSDQNGFETSLSGTIAYQFEETDKLSGGVGVSQTTAKEDYLGYSKISLTGSYAFQASIFTQSAMGMHRLPDQDTLVDFVISLGLDKSWYNEVNPTVDLENKRNDSTSSLGISASMNFDEMWAVVLNLNHVANASSLSNYDYTNNSITVGGTRTF